MFYQIIVSIVVKRLCAIITYENSIYKLPQELLNDLRTLNGKKHPKIKFQRLRKIRTNMDIWVAGSLN